jgi:hypothetical protein
MVIFACSPTFEAAHRPAARHDGDRHGLHLELGGSARSAPGADQLTTSQPDRGPALVGTKGASG